MMMQLSWDRGVVVCLLLVSSGWWCGWNSTPLFGEPLAEGAGDSFAAGSPSDEIQSANTHSLAVPDSPSAQEAISRHIANYTSEEYLPRLGLAWMRGQDYIEFISERIDELQLPRALLFLPMLESAFQPRALSSSGASGLWQFMMNSIAPYDMVVDFWRDDRRDFWIATDSALAKLMENYEKLGEWCLAIAAYNCGLGCVSRAMEEYECYDYWELRDLNALPQETIEYVPRLIALARLMESPSDLGFSDHPIPTYRWARVPLEFQISLELLAAETDIPLSLLKEANAELRYPVTPPADTGDYFLKIPDIHLQDLERYLAESASSGHTYYIHQLEAGETYHSLSELYKIPVEMIQRLNPGSTPTALRIGMELVVSSTLDSSPVQQRSELEYSDTYTVRSGDSLWSISQRFRISPESLARRNGLEVDGVLRVGSLLHVPQESTRR